MVGNGEYAQETNCEVYTIAPVHKQTVAEYDDLHGNEHLPPICSRPILQDKYMSVFETIGNDLGVDPNFIAAVAIQESGWNLIHVSQTNASSGGKPLNNLFGLTDAGNDNLAFSTVAESGAYWENDWKAALSNHPTTIQAFVNDLESDPHHMYNSLDPAGWKAAIAGSGGKWGTYQSLLNALSQCPN
jgi:hypothetical protein